MFKKVKAILGKFKSKALKAASVGATVGAVSAATMLSSFAAADDPVDIAITQSQVEVILDYIVQNIAVIMPVGIACMGVMIGIGLIPTIIKKFTNA